MATNPGVTYRLYIFEPNSEESALSIGEFSDNSYPRFEKNDHIIFNNSTEKLDLMVIDVVYFITDITKLTIDINVYTREIKQTDVKGIPTVTVTNTQGRR